MYTAVQHYGVMKCVSYSLCDYVIMNGLFVQIISEPECEATALVRMPMKCHCTNRLCCVLMLSVASRSQIPVWRSENKSDICHSYFILTYIFTSQHYALNNNNLTEQALFYNVLVTN